MICFLFWLAVPFSVLAADGSGCVAKKGVCKIINADNTVNCDGELEAGLCPGTDGPGGYQCCLPKVTTSATTNTTAGKSGLLPAPGDASHAAVPSGLPSNTNIGNYKINDLLELGKNVTNWILGMVGSAALLMFIWGGFQWLTSQGEPAKVTEGKKIMTAAIIGLVIVFSSYIMVKFVVVDVLNMKWDGGYVKSK